MTELSESDPIKTGDTYVVRLVSAVVAINLFVCALVGFSLNHSYRMYQERASVTSQNLSLSLRNNIDDTFDKADLALFAIAEEFAEQRNNAASDKHTLNTHLVKFHSRLPYLEGLRIADAQGKITFSSDREGPRTIITDREYFIRLRDNPAAGLVISKPIISRTLNKWVITCARRLNNPDGSFAGITYAVVGLEQITRVFSSLDMGKQGIVNLFDTDMSIYARYPELAGTGGGVGRDLKNSTVHRLIKAGQNSATFTTTSPLDGIKRTLTYQKISDKPLYVIVGVALNDYLAEWRKDAFIMTVMVTLFLVFTIISSFFMYSNRKRKKADLHALRNSESRFRSLFDNAPLGICTISAESKIINVNSAFCTMIGYSAEELTALNYTDISYSDDVAGHVDFQKKLLSDEIAFYTIEKRFVRKDREIVWGAETITLVRDKEDSVLFFIAMIMDITEQKKVEETLLHEQEFTFTALNSLPGVFYIISSSGKFLRWNENFEKITEYSSREFGLMSPMDLFDGPDKDLIRERIQEVFDTGSSEAEADLVSRNGTRIPYYFTGRTIQVGGVTCLIGMGVDIAERKNAEKSRNKALFFVESLLASSPTGISVYEGDTGNGVMANQAIADIIGGPIEYIRSLNFRDNVIWHEIGFYQVAESVLDDGITRRMEKEFITSFGKSVVLDAFFSKTVIDGKSYLMFIALDISEKKRLGEANKQIESQMLHVQKLESLGVLAGGIAHDFNNILTAVLGNADLAMMRLPPESPARENLMQIEKAAHRATDLARQMLAYSGKGQFVIENLNVSAVVEEMAKILEVSISKKSLLLFNFTPGLPAVEADATQLRQVVMNLVINASEAIGDNSGVIVITTGTIECDRSYLSGCWTDDNLPEGLYVYLEVVDTGCGMDRELLQKIFDPFFTTKFTGRGLGMSAVLGIIRGHKGAIKVHSEKGKGTSFKLLLPSSRHSFDQNKKTTANDGIWKGTGTILLVDDEESIRTMGKEMLHELGFDVLTASDGHEALEVFSRNKDSIMCVILDLTMPRMDGEQAFEELRRLKPDVRVLMSSGFNEQEVTRKFDGTGLSGFIQKPYNIMEVSKKLYEIIGDI
jgi:PAS domain S-box-containing protein